MFRTQKRDLGTVMREVEENLAIFLGTRNGGEKHRNEQFLVEKSNKLEDSTSAFPKHDSLLTSNALQQDIVQVVADYKFSERIDYDWRLAKPDNSLLPLIEVAVQESIATQAAKISNNGGIIPEYEPVTPTIIDSYAAAHKRLILPSGNQKPAPRSATTTPKPVVPSKSKLSVTSSVTIPSLNSTATQPRSSPPAKCNSHSDKSLSGKKLGTTSFKNSVSSGGTLLMPKKLASASRVRPSVPTAKLASSNGKQIQKSFSPTKVSAKNSTAHKSESVVMLLRSRGYKDEGDDVNPVLMGTKTVERVMSIRKLAPTKQDDERLSHDNTRKSSKDNLGFGRSLSKKALEMAIRHMDIRRSIPDSMLSYDACNRTST